MADMPPLPAGLALQAAAGVGVARVPLLLQGRQAQREGEGGGGGGEVEACWAPAALTQGYDSQLKAAGRSGLVHVMGMAPRALRDRAEMAVLWTRTCAAAIRRAAKVGVCLRPLDQQLSSEGGNGHGQRVLLVHVSPGGQGASWKESPLLGAVVAAALAALWTGRPLRQDAAVGGELVCPNGTLGGWAVHEAAAALKLRRNLRSQLGLQQLLLGSSSSPAFLLPAAEGGEGRGEEEEGAAAEVRLVETVQEALGHLFIVPEEEGQEGEDQEEEGSGAAQNRDGDGEEGKEQEEERQEEGSQAREDEVALALTTLANQESGRAQVSNEHRCV